MKPETERLKELMRLTGWNQAQTAQELGLAQSNVSRLLNEKTAMHGSTKVLLEKLMKEAEQSLAAAKTRRVKIQRRNTNTGARRLLAAASVPLERL